jgi:hypothetical protein
MPSVMQDHSMISCAGNQQQHSPGMTGFPVRTERRCLAAWLRAVGPPWILPRRLFRQCGASMVTARDAVGTAWAKMP